MKTYELYKIRLSISFDNVIGYDCDRSGGGRKGGLALFWNKEVEVELFSLSANHIDIRLKKGNKEYWTRFTGVYGWPDVTEKWKTWEMLVRIAGKSNLSCLAAGDFNEILSSAEKRGGLPFSLSRAESFRQCLNRIGLHDMGFEGSQFTWTNGQTGRRNVQERLDRGLISHSWMELFLNAALTHLHRVSSDHSPLSICWRADRNGRSITKSLSRFENRWMAEENIKEVIRSLWVGEGCLVGVADFAERRTNLLRRLKAWDPVKKC